MKVLILNKSAFILLVSLLMLWSTNCSRSAVPIMEPNFSMPDGINQEELIGIIKVALTGKRWIIQHKEEGQIIAKYTRGKISASISIIYSENNLAITYVDSSSLKYKEDGEIRYIHPKYNQWVNNLEFDLKLAILNR